MGKDLVNRLGVVEFVYTLNCFIWFMRLSIAMDTYHFHLLRILVKYFQYFSAVIFCPVRRNENVNYFVFNVLLLADVLGLPRIYFVQTQKKYKHCTFRSLILFSSLCCLQVFDAFWPNLFITYIGWTHNSK